MKNFEKDGIKATFETKDEIAAEYKPMCFIDEYPDDNTISKALNYYSDGIIKAHTKILDNPFLNLKNGEIASVGDPYYGAFIPSVALVRGDNMARSLIVNTQNNGFRFVGIDDDGNTVDIGPVTVPCLVGNVEHAYGLYVPLCNPDAISGTIKYLGNYLNGEMKRVEDLLHLDDEKSNCNSCESRPTIDIK